VGESVAVAATGYNHYETEQKTITAVSTDKKTITVDTPFVYRHFAAIERIAGQDFIMRAEVGLLTRNIVIQGDDMTEIYDHGSHLIFMGSTVKGLQAAISYTEIRQCGQPKIIARYCSHFHMAGEVPNSFVRGLAVHHSHARVLTIHGTHYLLVEKNVGYNVHGHNIFIEDGI
jgi:cell migration-inducing and hyaluronan-binding protein